MERADQLNILRAARDKAQPVPGGASIIVYDFADPDDYDEDQGQLGNESGKSSSRTVAASSSASASGRSLLNRFKGAKEDKVPCVRLLSVRSSEDASADDDGPESVDGVDADGGGSAGKGGSEACGELWVPLPSVAVLLESIGRVRWRLR